MADHQSAVKGMAWIKFYFLGLMSLIFFVGCGPAESLDEMPSPGPDTVSTTKTSLPTRIASETMPVLPPTATASPTRTQPQPSPTVTLSPTATETPTATLTPTLGPAVTRTPAPAALCPAPGSEVPVLDLQEGLLGLEEQIGAYLNGRGSSAGLQSALAALRMDQDSEPIEVEVLSRDVTGDTVPEVIIDIEIPDVDQNILIFGCVEGEYQLHYRYEFGQYWVLPSFYNQLTTIEDMNRDGVPEVVFSTIDFGAGFVMGYVILEWDGQKFKHLSEQGGVYSCPCIWGGAGEIMDTDGNGTRELVLSGDWSPRYGPGRTRYEVWAWNGQAFTVLRSYYDPPVYRFQAVYDGDTASQAGDYAQALALYQRAIFDESLFGWGFDQDPVNPRLGAGDPEERPLLSAYSRYRILLLHAVQGYILEAQTVYETLQARFPEGTTGSQYAELGRVFWEAFQRDQDFAGACRLAVDHAAAHAEMLLSPLSWPRYGDNEMRRYIPEDICLSPR